MAPKDWTLLVVAAAHGKGVSPVQLQKSLFLLGRNLDPARLRVDDFYEFINYDYGPFNRSIYDHADMLRSEGLLLLSPDSGSLRKYYALPTGIQRADELRRDLDPGAVEYLDRVVTWARSRNFKDLVRAIYEAYPETKVNSVFQY